jgi:hypothetical protein
MNQVLDDILPRFQCISIGAPVIEIRTSPNNV